MNYFDECICIEDVKEMYRKLCFKYHPDVNKEENANEIMKEINSKYDKAFNEFKNIFKNKEGKTCQDKKTVSETPEEFRTIMSILIHTHGLKIELIGSWIWITGNTKEYKEQLKKLKFRWCKNKKAWNWHRSEDNTCSKGNTTLNDIRIKYGSIEIKEGKKGVAQLFAPVDGNTTAK